MNSKTMRVTTKLTPDWKQLHRQNKEIGFGVLLRSATKRLFAY